MHQVSLEGAVSGWCVKNSKVIAAKKQEEDNPELNPLGAYLALHETEKYVPAIGDRWKGTYVCQGVQSMELMLLRHMSSVEKPSHAPLSNLGLSHMLIGVVSFTHKTGGTGTPTTGSFLVIGRYRESTQQVCSVANRADL